MSLLYDKTNQPSNGLIQNTKKMTIAWALISALSLSFGGDVLAKNNESNELVESVPYTYNDKKLSPTERQDVIQIFKDLGVLKDDNRFYYISPNPTLFAIKQTKSEERINPYIENDEPKYSVVKYNTGKSYDTWKNNAEQYINNANVLNLNKKIWELLVENSTPELYNVRDFTYKNDNEKFQYFARLRYASLEKASIQYFEFIQKNYPNEKNAYSALCDTIVQFNTLDMSQKEIRKDFLTCDENFRLKKEHTPVIGDSQFSRDYPVLKNQLLAIPEAGYYPPAYK